MLWRSCVKPVSLYTCCISAIDIRFIAAVFCVGNILEIYYIFEYVIAICYSHTISSPTLSKPHHHHHSTPQYNVFILFRVIFILLFYYRPYFGAACKFVVIFKRFWRPQLHHLRNRFYMSRIARILNRLDPICKLSILLPPSLASSC